MEGVAFEKPPPPPLSIVFGCRQARIQDFTQGGVSFDKISNDARSARDFFLLFFLLFIFSFVSLHSLDFGSLGGGGITPT